jgi:RND superfamily putative drug exporter
LFAALGRFSVRYRWAIIAFWLIAAVLSVRFLPSLSSVANNDNSAFLPNSAPSVQAANLANPFQKSNLVTGLIVAATTNGQPLSIADNAAITRIEHQVANLPTVKGVRDQGVSGDGQARKVLVETSTGGFNASGQTELVSNVRALFTGLPPGLQAHFTGQLPTQVDTNKSTQGQQNTTEKLSILFIIILLLIIFRSLLAPLVTLFPAFLAFTIAGPVVAQAAKAGVQVSGFTQFMLIVLMLGAGSDYGLFLIFRTREEMGRGLEPKPAITRALEKVGESITYSGTTVILAFVSLLLASFGLYRGLGPGLAIGIAIVLIVDLTLLPALLAVLGKSVFWPRIPRAGTYKEGIWGRVAGRAVGRPVQTLLLGIAIFGGVAFALLGYKPSGFGSTTGAPGSDSAIGQTVLEKHFPAADVNPTNLLFVFPKAVWSDPQVLVKTQYGLAASQLFGAVAGPLDPNGHVFTPAELTALHAKLGPPAALPLLPAGHLAVPLATYESYRSLAQFISPSGKVVQFYATLKAGVPSSDAAMAAVPSIRAAVAHTAATVGATDSGVAGQAAAFYDVSSTSGQDLVKVIPVVLIVIMLLLIMLLRSLVAPVYLIISVGLSYLASLGIAVLVFQFIGGSDGINFILPFFLFIFLMALGSDYNILVMSRVREEAHDLPLDQAVRRAVGSTGTTVTSAGLLLAGTFVVLTIATSGSIREIGFGLALGILLDTFLVRTLLVPSTVVLLGRWNWWPSRLYRDGHASGDGTSGQGQSDEPDEPQLELAGARD